MECSGNGEGRGGGRGVAKEGAVPTEADQVVGEGGTCANMLKVLVSKGEVAIGVDMEMEIDANTYTSLGTTTCEFLKGLGFMIAHGMSNRFHLWSSRSTNLKRK